MGWLSDITGQAEDWWRKADPIASHIQDEMANVPGSLESLHQGISGGIQGKYSWNPYGVGQSVGDVWGGGKIESQKPQRRAVGRQIGTMLGSYFGGQALGALFGGGASGAGAGASGTSTGLAETGSEAYINAGGMAGSGSSLSGAGGSAAGGSAYYDAGMGGWVDSTTGEGIGSSLPAGYTSESGSMAVASADQAASMSSGAYSPTYYDTWGSSSSVSPYQDPTITQTVENLGTGAESATNASNSLGSNWGQVTNQGTESATALENTGSQTFTQSSPDTLGEMANSNFTDSNSLKAAADYSEQGLADQIAGNTGGQSGSSLTGRQYMQLGQLGMKGFGSYDSYKQNKANMEMYKPYVDQQNMYRQQLADLYNNPTKSYNEFMMSGGRQFMNDARAKAAASGRIGSYLNTGRANTDLYAAYLQNLNARAGSLNNSIAQTAPYVQRYQQMQANKNAPLYDFGTSAATTLGSMFL